MNLLNPKTILQQSPQALLEAAIRGIQVSQFVLPARYEVPASVLLELHKLGFNIEKGPFKQGLSSTSWRTTPPWNLTEATRLLVKAAHQVVTSRNPYASELISSYHTTFERLLQLTTVVNPDFHEINQIKKELVLLMANLGSLILPQGFFSYLSNPGAFATYTAPLLGYYVYSLWNSPQNDNDQTTPSTPDPTGSCFQADQQHQ